MCSYYVKEVHYVVWKTFGKTVMNVVNIIECSMVDGPGIRTTVFCSGCPHHCVGCQNKSVWSPTKGEPLTNDIIENILNSITPNHITGVTLCGGEPLAPYNIEGMYSIICAIRERFGNTKTIWVYTGYLFEEVPDYIKDSVDYIMDGKYEKDNPTKKPFRGSDNQHYYEKKDGQWVMID